MSGQFSLEKLFEHLEGAGANLDDINYLDFADLMIDFTHTFSFIGKVVSLAFSDIATKAKYLKKNFKSTSFTGLQSMILDEIKCGTVRKEGKRPSTAITVLKLMWFSDFLRQIVLHLTTQLHWKLSKCVKVAYKETLSKHHPWTFRLAAKIGIKILPSRQEYMNKLFGNIPVEKQLELFRHLLELSDPLRDTLWGFYNENNLANIVK
ncbi:unnamed protein product [Blepharisma stoltei]|uniref:Glycolipid transfer protein domain-containing protein n=1 Tax=Blepharisma stoltei TaxID=1481888 RepID=A0AAU9JJ34_9CILI|nr:unnamed protein product [Blepharisma stoltei]